MNLKFTRRAIFLFLALVGTLTISFYLWLNLQATTSTQRIASPLHSGKPLSRRKPTLDDNAIYVGSGPSLINLGDLLAHCVVALRYAGKQVVEISEQELEIGSKGKTLEGIDDVITQADQKSHKKIVELLADAYPRLKVVSEEDDSFLFTNTVHQRDKSKKSNVLSVDRIELSQELSIQKDLIGRSPQISLEDTLIWIDPLDATKEYSEKLNHFVTLMACVVHNGKPIAGIIYKPFQNETYWSWNDPKDGKAHLSADLQHIVDASSIGETSSNKRNASMNIIISRSHAGNLEHIIKESDYGPASRVITAGGSGFKTIELISGRADAYVHMTRIKKWDICAPSAILGSLKDSRLTDLRGDHIRFDESKEKIVDSGVIATTDIHVHRALIKIMNTSTNL